MRVKYQCVKYESMEKILGNFSFLKILFVYFWGNELLTFPFNFLILLRVCELFAIQGSDPIITTFTIAEISLFFAHSAAAAALPANRTPSSLAPWPEAELNNKFARCKR